MVLAALGCALLVVALVAGYTRVAVLDSDQFADRAVAALDAPAVRDAVAQQLTDEVVLAAERDLVAVRPLVQAAAASVVGSAPFRALFRSAARDLHRTVFTRDRSTATATIADAGILLASALERLDPSAARRLPRDLSARIAAGEQAVEALDAARRVEQVGWLALGSALAAAAALAGAVALAVRRRRAVIHAGVAIAVAGAIVALAQQIVRADVLGDVAADRAAAGEVWDAFLGDLLTWALVTIAIGTVIAAAAASLLRPVEVGDPLRRAWALAASAPARPLPRAARAVALIVVGALIVVERRWVLDAALVLAGVFVLYQGVAELLRMVALPAPEAGHAAGGGRAAARRGRAAPWIAGGAAALLSAALVGGLIVGGGTRPVAAADAGLTACNGHAELCDRRVDEVAFAGTHNAMSGATYPDWLFAQQERGLSGQLRDGVRALLIDAHYGRRVGDRVLTELSAELRRTATRELGARGSEAALRIRDTLVAGDGARGPRATWLCHGFCEVGAIPLEQGLREIADFLAANRREVVIVVVQDEGPTPRDVARAVAASGLRRFVYTGRAGSRTGPPWPTLRELIERGQRAVMMFEHGPGDPAVPWYRDAYALMQETPYHFTDRSQFSCRPNRGPRDASLFLLNHWIDTSPAPRPSNAAVVNARDVLLPRARACERERDRLPNVVAVDFYATGDLLAVVDELNGVAPSHRR